MKPSKQAENTRLALSPYYNISFPRFTGGGGEKPSPQKKYRKETKKIILGKKPEKRGRGRETPTTRYFESAS